MHFNFRDDAGCYDFNMYIMLFSRCLKDELSLLELIHLVPNCLCFTVGHLSNKHKSKSLPFSLEPSYLICIDQLSFTQTRICASVLCLFLVQRLFFGSHFGGHLSFSADWHQGALQLCCQVTSMHINNNQVTARRVHSRHYDVTVCLFIDCCWFVGSVSELCCTWRQYSDCTFSS